nr:anti-sigma factor [Pontibacter sp. 172403-2]
MAASSAEIQAALQEACEAIDNYARLHAVPPRPELKASIMQHIAAVSPLAGGYADEADNVRPLYPAAEKKALPYRWMFAASVVLFLLSGFLSYHFYQKWQQAEGKLSTALASQQTLAQNYQTASYQLNQQEQLLRMLRDEDYRPVKLKGVEAHPNANVMVYWSPQQQKVYVDAVQLPALPAGKQYQLWALYDGKPIDAGMLQANGQPGMQQMKQIEAAQAFAITLEPVGGSINPTLDQMFVMGEIKS